MNTFPPSVSSAPVAGRGMPLRSLRARLVIAGLVLQVGALAAFYALAWGGLRDMLGPLAGVELALDGPAPGETVVRLHAQFIALAATMLVISALATYFVVRRLTRNLDRIGGAPLRFADPLTDLGARRDATELLRGFLEHLPAVAGIRDLEGRLLLANPAFERTHGIAMADALGKSIRDLYGERFARLFDGQMRAVIERGEALSFEDVGPSRHGDRTFLTTRFPIRDAAGSIVAVGTVATDISALRQAEQELRESEERFALVAAGSNDGIWDWDFARDRHYISPRLKSMLGYAESELDSRREAYRQCIHADDRERVIAAVDRYLREGGAYEDEYRMCRKQGGHIWVRTRGAALRATDGTVTRFCGAISEISTQREASERVNALLDEQRAMLDNLVAGIARLKDRKIAMCNRRFAEMYGYSVDELVGQPTALLHPDAAHDREGDAVYADLARDGKVGRQFLHRRRDGSLVWVYSSGTALDRDDPRADSIWIDVDISEQKRAEQALRENEARFYHAVRGSRDAIWDWDLVGGRYYLSPRMREMLGYGYGEPIVDRAWFIGHLHEDDRERMQQAVRRHLEDNQPYEIEYRLRARDGSVRWTRARGQAVRDASGRATRFSGANSDITAEREASERIRALVDELRREKELVRRSEERYRAFIAQSQEAIWRFENAEPVPTHLPVDEQVVRILDNSRLAECNLAHARIYGFATEQEALGMPIESFGGREANRALIRAFVRGGYRIASMEWSEMLHGEERWFLGSVVGVIENGCLVRAWGTQSEITAHKRAEQALRASDARFSSIVNSAMDAIVCCDDGYRIVVFNHAAERIFGIAAAQALGQRLETLLPERLRAGHAQHVQRFAASGETARRIGGARHPNGRRADGSEFPIEASIAHVVLDGRSFYSAILRDVSERLRNEQEIGALNQQLEQRVAERTAELTRANRELESFSYTVSHDLSAPLRAINGFSALLVAELGGRLEPSAQRLLERIAAGSMQMKALIDDLLRLAQISRTRLVVRELDLAALARRIAAECAQDNAGRSVAFSAPAALPAHGDASLLGIALTNLLGNAWKFTARSDPARVEFGALERDGETVYFLRDNGAGFDMRYADKLFKPFQRLHSAKEFDGTGIGLAIVHRILERHGGRIWAESTPGAGTSFHFTLGQTTISSGAHVNSH